MARYPNMNGVVIVCKDEAFLVVKNNQMTWTTDRSAANQYASKYAAKSHLKTLTDNLDGIEYAPLK